MRGLLSGKQSTRVRAIAQTDAQAILRMVDNAWRIHMRMSPVELGAKLSALPGFLAEDNVGLRGFMVIEPQHPHVALVIAAGLRDTWTVRPYLDLLLPVIEQAVRANNLASLVHIGNGAWLTNELWRSGFETYEWIVAFERCNPNFPPPGPAPAQIRPARHGDLPTILQVDSLAFDSVWRKSVGNFTQALASADLFSVAEVKGQIVGYNWCEIYHRHAHLTRLAVHPNYQGLGIGAQMLRQVITDVLNRGVSLMTLNTQENNRRSQTLYERFGFVNTQQRMPVLWKDLK